MTHTPYVIMRLEDVQRLVAKVRGVDLETTASLDQIMTRIDAETGANIEDIVKQLKKVSFCPACQIESQQHSCSSIYTNRLGRRLGRLVDRANYKTPPKEGRS